MERGIINAQTLSTPIESMMLNATTFNESDLIENDFILAAQTIPDPMQAMTLNSLCFNNQQPNDEQTNSSKSSSQPYLYVPLDVWKIIISHLSEKCDKCGGRICRECIDYGVFNDVPVHTMCKTCDKLICHNEKTYTCMSCSTELHKECYVSGLVKKTELTSYSISNVCKLCFEKRRSLIMDWGCIP